MLRHVMPSYNDIVSKAFFGTILRHSIASAVETVDGGHGP